jgi:hypothetical protein
MDEKQLRKSFLNPVLEWAKSNQQKKGHHLKSMLRAAGPGAEAAVVPEPEEVPFTIPAQFNGKDYITMLLHVDAEIEHGLMLQYLYSAYSIGGPGVPEQYRERVHNWKSIILGISKEEMGHFISVQNVLKIIGAPLNFGRESYPWDVPFYPFPFTLERFTLKSLAKYVYAEAPSDWLTSDDPIAVEINESVHAQASDPHTVGALFKVLLQLIQDPAVIPDEAFQPGTYPYQAKFDEWGRGYTGGERGSADARFMKSPDVLVAPLLSRDDAYNALSEIAEQGEGEEVDSDTPSHFERFLFIYKEFKDILAETGGAFDPAYNVATNPYAGEPDDAGSASNEPADEMEQNVITNPEAILWANLLDTRYRLLLNFLNHSFLLDNGNNNTGSFTPRGLIINSTFGEMYNLRSLATILVQTPLAEGSKLMAGPPFTSPYSFDLPFGEHNRWRLHRDLLEVSGKLIDSLKAVSPQPNMQYLNVLKEIDRKLLQAIAQLMEAEPA